VPDKFIAMREACAIKPHGTRARYVSGCKCPQCRAANSRYSCEAQRRHDAGETGTIVPADAAREHIQKLAKAGVGRRAIAAASDVGATIIHEIKLGRGLRIRASTERKILSVTADARSAAALVSAASAWRRVNELLQRGYTRGQLALWLGAKTPALQLNKKTITAKSAARVERMYRLLQAGRLMRETSRRLA
jgi:hypothetical protein